MNGGSQGSKMFTGQILSCSWHANNAGQKKRNFESKLKEHSQPQAIETYTERKELLLNEDLQQIITTDAESNSSSDEYSDD